MCKKRLPYYTDLIIDLEEKPALADLCGFKSIPTAKIFSRVMDEERMGIEPFRELFYDLSKTSRSLGLWKGRLVGLDGSLIKSNTSSYKNKETGEYSDKDAGLYIRKNYIKGVGHLSYKMDDLEYGLPILIQRYKGSSNENPLYRLAIDEFYVVYGFYPRIISVDRGMDSVANNDYSVEKGIEAYLQARDFGKRELVKTEKGKCFRPEYIAVNNPSFLERIADRRSECERSFSRDKCGYRRDEMSNRGSIEAELYMLITGITTHLTAITAYHVGRTDLMRSPTAFRRMNLDWADKAANNFLE
jgi:Transposase DDE domain